MDVTKIPMSEILKQAKVQISNVREEDNFSIITYWEKPAGSKIASKHIEIHIDKDIRTED